MVIVFGIQLCELTKTASTTNICGGTYTGKMVTLNEKQRSYTMQCSCAQGCESCERVNKDFIKSECFSFCEIWNATVIDTDPHCIVGMKHVIKKRNDNLQKLRDGQRFLRAHTIYRTIITEHEIAVIFFCSDKHLVQNHRQCDVIYFQPLFSN